MKAPALFIASLCLSLTVHGLVLFTPSWSIPGSAPQGETYRVNLIEQPAQAVGKANPEKVPVLAVDRKEPKPPQNPVKPRVAETRKPEPTDDIEEKQAADSQLRQELYQATDHEVEVLNTTGARSLKNPSPGIPGSTAPAQRTDYQRILEELNRLLREHLHYPETARRKGIEGSLAVTFTLKTNGNVSDVAVSESSGSHLLDRAAVRAVSSIFPYPDPPDTPLHFTIPVTYRLAEPD